MTYARRFHRAPPPTKASQRADLMLVALQRVGLETPPHMVASIARSHGLSIPEVEKALADAVARRAGDV